MNIDIQVHGNKKVMDNRIIIYVGVIALKKQHIHSSYTNNNFLQSIKQIYFQNVYPSHRKCFCWNPLTPLEFILSLKIFGF